MLNGFMPWGVLGLEPTGDTKAIRRNYAALIRQWRPDTHPMEFARVREAYESAMEESKYYLAYEGEAGQEDAQEETGETRAEDSGQRVVAEPVPVAVPASLDAAPVAEAPPQFIPPLAPGYESEHLLVFEPAQFIPAWKPGVDRVEPPPDFIPAFHPAPQPPRVPEVHIPEAPLRNDADLRRRAIDTSPAGTKPIDAPLDAEALVQELFLHARRVGSEASSLALLRKHLRQCDAGTIDARMDYEWALLRGLLELERPPLALVFEAARQLHWTDAAAAGVRRQLGDDASSRLAVLLEMADQYVFSTRYSSNPWDQRLFAPAGTPISWFGVKPYLNDMPPRVA